MLVADIFLNNRNYINDLSFDINDANILKDSFLLNKNIQKEIIISIENVTTIDRTACFQLRTYLRYIDRNQEFTNCYLGLAKRYIAFLRENS